jgi:hypothetical protein
MGKDIRDGHGPRDHANPRGLLGAMSAALTVFGLINAAAVAAGAWVGSIRWPVLRCAYAVVRD